MPKNPRRRYYNPPPSDDELSDNTPRDAVKVQFGRNIFAHMNARGWNQSELARRATERLPKGMDKTIGRDSIGGYIAGKSLPGPIYLKAIADAFGVATSDLLPTYGAKTAGEDNPELDVKQLSGGTAWLRVNKEVPWPVALEVMKMLVECDGTDA